MRMKTLVILTKTGGFSGIDGPVFNELAKQWDIVARVDPFTMPLAHRCRCLVASLRIDWLKWKDEYYKRLDAYNRSPGAFCRRTERCQKKLDGLLQDYDAMFQLSSLFLPSWNGPTKPYAVYLDRTFKMRERYSPEAVGFMTTQELSELNTLHKRVFNTADRVFTFNEITKDSVVNDYGVDSTKVITVGYGVNMPQLPGSEKSHCKLVLTVCSDFERHRGQMAIDAFEIAHKKVPQARFIFVGESLKRSANGVEFLRVMPYSYLMGLYAQASIVVVPSLLGGAQTITDAMANKCVCIANAGNPYVPGLIADKENGLLFSKNEPCVVADLITFALNNEGLIHSMGEKAQDHIREKFTWARAVSTMSRHLAELI
jgi:glycosyltransferase involved in cell wall biosynthesis